MDGNGALLAATTTAANGNERLEVEKLLDKIPPIQQKNLNGRMRILEADKGYDSERLRQLLLSRGIFPFIPYRKIKGRDIPKTQDVMAMFHLEKNRWKVERSFSWLKRRCRRLLLRWERNPEIWNGFVTLGLIYMWIGNLVG